MITRVLKALWRTERNTIETHTERCCRNRDRHSTCRRCVDACPAHALEIDDGLQLDLERCLECGICAAMCPTGALQVRVPSNEQILADVRQRLLEGYRDIVFACNRNAAAAPGGVDVLVRASCLGRLDESILVGAVALGARSVGLLEAACSTCPHPVSRATAGQSLERTQRLLTAFGSTAEVRLIQTLPDVQKVAPAASSESPARPAQATGMSRRDLFRGFLRETTRAGSDAIGMALELDAVQPAYSRADGGANIGLKTALPAKRLLLRSGLRRLSTQSPDGWAEAQIAGEQLWAHPSFGESCTGCQMCAFFCPTGALRKVDEPGRKGVEFHLADCVDCHLCLDVCHQDAITLGYQIPAASVLDDSTEMLVWRDAPADGGAHMGQQRLEDALRRTLDL